MMKGMLVIVQRFEYYDEKHVSDSSRFEYYDEKHVSDSSKIRILWWKAC